MARVQQSVATAAAELGAEHPHHGFRAALDDLGARLAHVHDRCSEVSDDAWAAYAARLDRGLDELQVELGRAAEHADSAPSADDVLFSRTTRLELDGWLVRLDVPGAAPDHGRATELASAASRELADYRAACSTGAGASRAAVEQAMADLRRAAH
ncbi:hypothetical protein BJF78_16790 [Pseudonocardia sp. CNS-139]|nr:hypothetical protein BJF78_16790 [Pseudonocardia sp. CNS-139]